MTRDEKYANLILAEEEVQVICAKYGITIESAPEHISPSGYSVALIGKDVVHYCLFKPF